MFFLLMITHIYLALSNET